MSFGFIMSIVVYQVATIDVGMIKKSIVRAASVSSTSCTVPGESACGPFCCPANLCWNGLCHEEGEVDPCPVAGTHECGLNSLEFVCCEIGFCYSGRCHDSPVDDCSPSSDPFCQNCLDPCEECKCLSIVMGGGGYPWEGCSALCTGKCCQMDANPPGCRAPPT